jgi:septal ring factor EnvC (AmiA/AmiB activator)
VQGWPSTLSPVTAQPDLPHKVSQIRHDLDDLYELMSRVEKGQTRIERVLDRHNDRFEQLQQTLDQHDGRLDGIEDNQHRTNGRLDRIEDNQHQTNGRLDRIEDNHRQQFAHLSAQMAEILGVLRGPAAADPAPESER